MLVFQSYKYANSLCIFAKTHMHTSEGSPTYKAANPKSLIFKLPNRSNKMFYASKLNNKINNLYTKNIYIHIHANTHIHTSGLRSR